jgi:hypothetical protein
MAKPRGTSVAMALAAVTANVAVFGITAADAVSPANKCEAAKLKIAGKYEFCRAKAWASAAKTGCAQLD